MNGTPTPQTFLEHLEEALKFADTLPASRRPQRMLEAMRKKLSPS